MGFGAHGADMERMEDQHPLRSSALDLCGAGTSAAIAADAGAVRSHLEYVLDEHAGALEPDQRRVLEAAWRNSRRIVKFAEDLRDLALAEAGELPLSLGVCDLGQVVAEAVRTSWPVAAAGHTTIDLEVEGRPRPEGDPVQLARVVSALVEHAVEHATPGTTIAAHASDTGLTLDFATETSPLDDPLGLALASAVAKLHGGRLFVEPGEGRTTLTLTFGPASAARAA
jgi:signal transduction histidine kinase